MSKDMQLEITIARESRDTVLKPHTPHVFLGGVDVIENFEWGAMREQHVCLHWYLCPFHGQLLFLNLHQTEKWKDSGLT